MIYLREEGQAIRTGFNFYPLKSNQFGLVFKIKNKILTARYNKLQGNFKFNMREEAQNK